MKLLNAILLLTGIVTVASHAQTPLPPKSSISIKETPSVIPAPNPVPPSKCKLAHNLVTYTPAVRLGADAQDGSMTWRFYVGIKNSEGKGLRLVSEKSLPSGVPPEIAPIVADSIEWECSCCRSLNRSFPKLMGWYAELTSNGKVLASASSLGGNSEMANLIEKKAEVPKAIYNGSLSFTSPDLPSTPPSVGSPQNPAHLTLASYTKLPNSEKLKGPSGRTLYVSTTPLLTPSDILSANRSGPLHGKSDCVRVTLNPTGIKKLVAVTKSSDEPFLVIVNGETLVADKVSVAPYATKDTLIINGRFSENELNDIALSLRQQRRATPTPTPPPAARATPSPAAESNPATITEATPATAPESQSPANSGKPWTPEEEQALRDAVAKGETAEQIALTLQRTTKAITSRIKKLGLSE